MKRLSLFLYNLLFVPLLLLLLPGYLLRIWRRGGYWNQIAQRFCIFESETLNRIGMGRIWIHAVSVGEVGIALKFAKSYHLIHPRSRFLVSTTTSTGLKILQGHASLWLEPIANPVDFPILTSKLVRKIRPSALLMIEGDLWPNRLAVCTKLGIPTALLNARLSERSENRFRLVRFLTAPLFNELELITITEHEDIERWKSLGAKASLLHWTGNIKYDHAPESESSATSQTLPMSSGPVIVPEALGWRAGDCIMLAASTHRGEELELARAFLELRQVMPDLRLVIAPRHVERRREILEELREKGITCALRSQKITSNSDVLLLDTTGELSSWYGLSTVVFVGKSLPCSVNHGGQNMIEPLQARRVVITGPNTGNFEPIASRLYKAGALLRATDARSIAAQIGPLLLDADLRNEMIRAADVILHPNQGATARNCKLVEEMIESFT